MRPALAFLWIVACGEPTVAMPNQIGSAVVPRPPLRPFLVVLGIAQDGGVPHAACSCPRCDAARLDPARAARVASLGLRTSTGADYLFDATPDFPDQLHTLRGDVLAQGKVDRSPLAGIFVTHAHIGHYFGLAYLGFEVVSSTGTKVWASPAMNAFLRENAPWDQLVRQGNVVLHDVPHGDIVRLDEVSVTPFRVPHRDEYADTVGYRIRGPNRTVVYVPDTEPWRTWSPSLLEVLAEVDVALLDGTFHSPTELPGRDVSSIGHPLMLDTMNALETRVRNGSLEVHFIHLNHSNPVLDPHAPARTDLEARGFHVAYEGQTIGL